MNDRAIMKDVTINELFKTVDLNGSKLLKRLSKKNSNHKLTATKGLIQCKLSLLAFLGTA